LEQRRAPRRRRLGAAIALAGAAAVAVLAFVVLPGGAEAPSVAEAAALSSRGPTGGPPPRYDGVALLDRQIGGIWFPRWQERFGWRASGVREDRLGGRRTSTVYYANKGRRIAYTIVDGPSLAHPPGAVTRRAGVAFRSLRSDARTVVTWRQNGHTCILSAASVGSPAMIRLAASRATY
jgi:hypothetical protein